MSRSRCRDDSWRALRVSSLAGMCAALAGASAGAMTAGCGGAPAPPPGDALDQVDAAQLFHLGNQLAEGGDSVRAEQYLSAAMIRGYPEAEVIPRLMDVCIEASRLSTALGYAEPYLERHADDWALRLLVATLQLTLNQPAQARAHLERVVLDRPDEPAAHYLLGVLYRDRLHDAASANPHFARYLELAPDGPHAAEARISMEGFAVPAAVPSPPPASEDAPTHPVVPTRLPPHDTSAPDTADLPRGDPESE